MPALILRSHVVRRNKLLPRTSVIIPANNEEAFIGACFDGLMAQSHPDPVEIILSANACVDATVAIAERYRPQFAQKGWQLVILDHAEGGKLPALNRADDVARGDLRLYLDADVVMSPALLGALIDVLDQPQPTYASGQLVVAPAKSWVTRAYGRIWTKLPFMREGVPGAGLFAVNAEGRSRWGAFPEIISDDTFVRLQFTPKERVGVAATYQWPLVEGFAGLVRVRRRQDAGVDELRATDPDLFKNEGKPPLGPMGLLQLAAKDPVGFAVYVAVSVAVRAKKDKGWTRGR